MLNQQTIFKINAKQDVENPTIYMIIAQGTQLQHRPQAHDFFHTGVIIT